jgi:hypothetical protein
MLYQRVPILEILKALMIRYVICEDDGLSAINVVPNHLSSDGLATDIPQLNHDFHTVWQPHLLDEKVYSDSLFVSAESMKKNILKIKLDFNTERGESVRVCTR